MNGRGRSGSLLLAPTRERARRLLLAFTTVGLGAGSATAQEPLSWPGMQEGVRSAQPSTPTVIRYGPGDVRFGELQVPSGPGPHPVAIVVHGGCWLSMADVAYVRPLATALNRMGWATWSLEFNRIDQPEGRWPGILDDVAAGADHLRALAAPHQLDLDRVVTVGHSSGGHLALWLAARGRSPRGASPNGANGSGGAPLPVRGVVGLAPVTGLEDFQARSDRCGAQILTRLLDATPGAEGDDEPSRWRTRLAETDPWTLLPLGVPQLLIFGGLDTIVPPAHGEAWRARAESTGDDVVLRVVPGAGHFELVAPWTAPWVEVESALHDFLGVSQTGG